MGEITSQFRDIIFFIFSFEDSDFILPLLALLILNKVSLLGFELEAPIFLLVTSEKAETYANPAQFGVRYGGQEFVRHKMLDVLGTLALAGNQFEDTEFKFEMTGHKFDLHALKKLFASGCFRQI